MAKFISDSLTEVTNDTQYKKNGIITRHKTINGFTQNDYFSINAFISALSTRHSSTSTCSPPSTRNRASHGKCRLCNLSSAESSFNTVYKGCSVIYCQVCVIQINSV